MIGVGQPFLAVLPLWPNLRRTRAENLGQPSAMSLGMLRQILLAQ